MTLKSASERGRKERREERQGEMKGKPRNGREETLASYRSSSEKRRKGAFLRRVAVEANHGLYSDRPCSALFHSLSSSRNINRTRRGDVYVLVEPNLMNARLRESVNDKAAFAVSSFSSRRRKNISTSFLQTIAVSVFDRNRFSSTTWLAQ